MAKTKKQPSAAELNLEQGIHLVESHLLFSKLGGRIYLSDKNRFAKGGAALVSGEGSIYLNKELLLSPSQWAYSIAHCRLHLAFGHFDANHMPGYEVAQTDGSTYWKPVYRASLWNMACDIFITKFLADMKFGQPLPYVSLDAFPGSITDERKIYTYLLETNQAEFPQNYGTAGSGMCDMLRLENPIRYQEKLGRRNLFAEKFAWALANSASHAVSIASGRSALSRTAMTKSEQAAAWFIGHYPLLGGLAAGFRIIEDADICIREEIQVAAVDVTAGELYINPAATLNFEELKFVMAHEFLHAGLMHHERCQGRNPYFWNIACDYVINGWLHDMGVGQMPQIGVLYDETLAGRSAESIYDQIITDIKTFKKDNTLRGYGKGDIFTKKKTPSVFSNASSAVSLDEFYKSALVQGLEYHQARGRGYVAAGLIEEIRALAMPPIPWDVKLANWFDSYFPAIEKTRSYSRPSRRQASTPDIPRPSYIETAFSESARTFGVIVDTSGSMSTKDIGLALGAIASYSASRSVPFVRVVFCDAAAYDAGYLALEDIAGRVEVRGRGGTRLQPGVDLLEQAKDFPKSGPILLITDGEIEPSLSIHRDHAYLLPRGCHLPFRTKSEVFYFSEN